MRPRSLAPLNLLAGLLLAGLLLVGASCSAPALRTASPPGMEDPSSPVQVLVLGTAQDAGLPQVGCESDCCRGAWADPSRRRLVTSLLLSDARTGRRWLFDATPDLVRQVELARGTPPTRDLPGPRPPLFDGVFLTHAHMGHYTGLLQLGREAYGARGVALHATERMLGFLTEHEPWRSVVVGGEFELHPLEPDAPVRLAEDLTVTPFLVPHRDELSDTVGFRIQGPDRALLYLPDIDKWSVWERPLEEVLEEVDVALLDGAFFADGEIPGRAMADIPHPFVTETIERLAPLPDDARAKVVFTHLNHTNPAARPGSPAERAVHASGMAIAREGMRFGL